MAFHVLLSLDSNGDFVVFHVSTVFRSSNALSVMLGGVLCLLYLDSNTLYGDARRCS